MVSVSIQASIFSIFHDTRTFLFRNRSLAKLSLLPLKPSHFRTNVQSKLNIFPGLVLGHPCFVIFPRWCLTIGFWDPPLDPAQAKTAPNTGGEKHPWIHPLAQSRRHPSIDRLKNISRELLSAKFLFCSLMMLFLDQRKRSTYWSTKWLDRYAQQYARLHQEWSQLIWRNDTNVKRLLNILLNST